MALPALATACHGYSGADLAALCREAAMTALSDAAAAMLAGQASTTLSSLVIRLVMSLSSVGVVWCFDGLIIGKLLVARALSSQSCGTYLDDCTTSCVECRCKRSVPRSPTRICKETSLLTVNAAPLVVPHIRTQYLHRCNRNLSNISDRSAAGPPESLCMQKISRLNFHQVHCRH